MKTVQAHHIHVLHASSTAHQIFPISHFNATENSQEYPKKADASGFWSIWCALRPAQPAGGSNAESKTFPSPVLLLRKQNARLAQTLTTALPVFLAVRPKILLNHRISQIKHQSQCLITFCNDNYITSQSQLLNLRWSSTLSNPFSSLPANHSSSPCVNSKPHEYPPVHFLVQNMLAKHPDPPHVVTEFSSSSFLIRT